MATLRILLLADSHLGFDLPLRPRVARRRRGHDFLANHVAALAPAAAGEVDLVVHAGDVFHRPRVPASLAYQAYEPLLGVAERGVPVFLVPGNHERSRLPHAGLLVHERVHVFDRPRTFAVDVAGKRVALAGFPYERRGVRAGFAGLLERTGWGRVDADVRLLCLHHCVEGATVGPGDHTFDRAPDVIRGADLPAGFAAVLSGHIHRHQVLTTDLRGRPLPAPVLYPGSVERTSIAELGEPKGYLVVELRESGTPSGFGSVGHAGSGQVGWEFRRLPARPMIVRDVTAEGLGVRGLEAAVRSVIADAPADAVLRIRVAATPADGHGPGITAARLRSLAPATMNVEVRLAGRRPVPRAHRAHRASGRSGPAGAGDGDANLRLAL